MRFSVTLSRVAEFFKQKTMSTPNVNQSKRLYKMKVTDANKTQRKDIYARSLNEAFKIFKEKMKGLTYGDTEWSIENWPLE